MPTSTRAIKINGRTTTVSLDDAFWTALEDIAAARGQDVQDLITRIAEIAGPGRIAAGLRVFVVETLGSGRPGPPR